MQVPGSAQVRRFAQRTARRRIVVYVLSPSAKLVKGRRGGVFCLVPPWKNVRKTVWRAEESDFKIPSTSWIAAGMPCVNCFGSLVL
jgi:hypothetical protein